MASTVDDDSPSGNSTVPQMPSSQTSAELGDFLLQGWALEPPTSVPDFAKLNGYSVTDLVIEHLNGHGALRKQLLDKRHSLGATSNPSPPPLATLAIGAVTTIPKTARFSNTPHETYKALM